MNNINILWTSDNKLTALTLIGMYTVNSLKNNWWDNVTVIIWGGVNELIAKDKEVQEVVKTMIDKHVKVYACEVCSDKANTTQLLKDLGVEVKYMGNPMTKLLQSEDKFITI